MLETSLSWPILRRGREGLLTAVTTVATCLYPENTFAVLLAMTSPTRWPPVTLANGAPSRVAGNFGVGEKSPDSNLPVRTWYWSTPVNALWFTSSSDDLGFLVMRLTKAVSDGANIVMFWAVDRAWTTSGTRPRRPGQVSLLHRRYERDMPYW